jgi:hypothetical protein
MATPSQITAVPKTNRTTEDSHGGGDHAVGVMPGRMISARLLRLAPVVLLLLALLLFGAGVASLFGTTARDQERGALSVDAPVKSFGDAPSGKRVALIFTLQNRSARPIRVVGAGLVCGLHGCLTTENLPLEVSPSSSRDLIVYVETGQPGHFAGELTIFSDSPGQLRTMLGVNGRVTENPEKF